MRPISAIGETARERGFTLVEVLVVLVILGLASSAVLLTLPVGGMSLTTEAQRFTARLIRAQEEAILTNRTVEVRIDAEGYAFDVRRGATREALPEPFARQTWQDETTVRVEGPADAQRLVLDPTGFATPATISFFRADGRMAVLLDASGRVTLDDAPL
jgi:general secretion pathway protein H